MVKQTTIEAFSNELASLTQHVLYHFSVTFGSNAALDLNRVPQQCYQITLVAGVYVFIESGQLQKRTVFCATTQPPVFDTCDDSLGRIDLQSRWHWTGRNTRRSACVWWLCVWFQEWRLKVRQKQRAILTSGVEGQAPKARRVTWQGD